jgi:hypothetical protein
MTTLHSLQSTHQRSALPTLNYTRSVLQKLHEAEDRPIPPAARVTLSPLAARDWQRDPPVRPHAGQSDSAPRESWDTAETRDAAPPERGQPDTTPPERSQTDTTSPERVAKSTAAKARASLDGLTQDQRDMVAELVQRDREVHTHEAAHQAAGGGLVRNASYTYQEGPDGRAYAIGGECPIQIPASDSPSELIAIAQRVRSAALAPANPSGADMAVANAAAQMEMQARQQLAQQQAEQQQAPSASQSAPAAAAKPEKGSAPSGDEPAAAAGTANRAMVAYARNAPIQASREIQSPGP